MLWKETDIKKTLLQIAYQKLKIFFCVCPKATMCYLYDSKCTRFDSFYFEKFLDTY